MNISVKSPKTGKFYNIALGGNDARLMLRMQTFLTLTGALSALTAMSLFAAMTSGQPNSQEIFLAFAIVTLLTGRRALTVFSEVKKRINELIIKYELEHPH